MESLRKRKKNNATDLSTVTLQKSGLIKTDGFAVFDIGVDSYSFSSQLKYTLSVLPAKSDCAKVILQYALAISLWQFHMDLLQRMFELS